MKKIIFGVIALLILIKVGIFYFNYIYVPKGETYRLIYSSFKQNDAIGNVKDEKAELKDNGLYTRTTFTKPGDIIEYQFTIANDGTMDVKLLKDPIHLKLDYYFKKHIKYEITDKDRKPLQKGDVIKSGEVKLVYVRISYLNNSDFATKDSFFYESRVLLPYVQDRK